ncbi:MAG: EscJ/YscJ/HrcJ family type III secretion inner membrane ring protein [Gammaproteobacteria bacterium]|nr:EscJ/YscJ/HrcJ family type III secretion inner membrane ring protein [Gammaproteobacteria bacterium]
MRLPLSSSFRVAGRWLIVALVGFGLSGCYMTELYSQLDEQEGNEMLALLLQHDISSEKRAAKDNMVSLFVDSDKIPFAMELLRKNGYPKDKFSTIRDLFNADKLIATPYEDRTRYIYGLSQELADTLSRVDGVMTARVHLVIPTEEDESPVASAAVFIKHNPNYDMEEHIPQIKSIVASGIDSLAYEAVNVALFPAEPGDVVRLGDEPLRSILAVEMAASSVGDFYVLFASFAGVLLLSLVGNVYLFFRGRPRLRAQEG